MKRRLVDSLCAASLVVCVATTILWVRSYWVEDFVCVKSEVDVELASSLGSLRLYVNGWRVWGQAATTGIPTQTGWHHIAQSAGPHPKLSWWGFSYSASPTPSCVQWPYWSVATALLLLPAARSAHWLTLRHIRKRDFAVASSASVSPAAMTCEPARDVAQNVERLFHNRRQTAVGRHDC